MPFVTPTSRRRPRALRPPRALGLLAAVACLAIETGVGVLLLPIAPAASLGVLYLVGLVLVASVWGFRPGVAMAVASTVAFGCFLVAPGLGLARHEGWAVLAIFLAVAVLVCALARLVPRLTAGAEAREEAGLYTELARLLLRAPELGAALPAAARKVARALGLPSASIQEFAPPANGERLVFPLRVSGVRAALVVPARLDRPAVRRLRERVAPSLEVLLEAAHERERIADALRSNRDELARILDREAGLRRLATLVAHAAPPAEVFQAIAREMCEVLGLVHTVVARFEPDGTAICVGSWDTRPGVRPSVPLAAEWGPEPGTVTEIVWRTWATGRVDLRDSDGDLSRLLRDRGIVASAGCPIVVGGSLWGLVASAASTPDALPADVERRMSEFTELAAAAIANAQSNADLRASRARVVTAADEARRRIERDLHDGAQQRLVSIGLELRDLVSSVPGDREDLRRKLSGTVKALEETVGDLQKVSRGLHPAALAKGGLESGLIVLTRRCGLPVDLDVSLSRRPAKQVEVTAYYIVSEALTNAAKHAGATSVRVGIDECEGRLRVSVHDDGAGGADPSRGSGLLGLADRVEALGGALAIVSPVGQGTTLLAELPFEPAD